jgi:hypothetical protein
MTFETLVVGTGVEINLGVDFEIISIGGAKEWMRNSGALSESIRSSILG